MGRVTDINGNSISELYSEHLTANVDIAKDPFIFRLNVNSFTANVRGFMTAIGADKEFINRFLTQPIVLEYVKERLQNESISVESTRGDKDEFGKSASVYKSDDTILKELYKKYTGKDSNRKF